MRCHVSPLCVSLRYGPYCQLLPTQTNGTADLHPVEYLSGGTLHACGCQGRGASARISGRTCLCGRRKLGRGSASCATFWTNMLAPATLRAALPKLLPPSPPVDAFLNYYHVPTKLVTHVMFPLLLITNLSGLGCACQQWYPTYTTTPSVLRTMGKPVKEKSSISSPTGGMNLTQRRRSACVVYIEEILQRLHHSGVARHPAWTSIGRHHYALFGCIPARRPGIGIEPHLDGWRTRLI